MGLWGPHPTQGLIHGAHLQVSLPLHQGMNQLRNVFDRQGVGFAHGIHGVQGECLVGETGSIIQLASHLVGYASPVDQQSE